MSESRIHNVFFEEDLNKISNKLKSKLLPVDKAGCQELLIDLGKSDSDARQAELRRFFPTYKDGQGYDDKAILGDDASIRPTNWQSLRNRAKSLFYSEQGEHIHYEKRSDGKSYPVSYVFDAFTGRVYEKNTDGWELHHIDFDKTHNDFDNFLWVMKLKDPDTGRSSHQTIFSSAFDHKEYIAIGRMIKIAFRYGYAPRSWSYERQAYYYEVLREQQRRFITN